MQLYLGMDDKHQPSENAGMVILKDFPLIWTGVILSWSPQKPSEFEVLNIPLYEFLKGKSPI